MANIEDYLKWRGDLDFKADPFNEVDAVILSELAYVDFKGIVDGPAINNKITLKEANDKFFSCHTDEEILSRPESTKMAAFVMRQMATTKRFSKMKLSGYINEIDNTTQSQFSVVTCFLSDGTIFVSYRGTDNTLTGWREDFNMSFLHQTAGQLSATNYLNDNFLNCNKHIIVGGHSKGGNFAVYASTFCDKKVQDRIDMIYSNDGPGLKPELTELPEYQAIINRIHFTTPEFSIVGTFFERKYKVKIISSSNSGLSQHDLMSWQVEGNHLVISDSYKDWSKTYSKALKNWLKDVDYESRQAFGDTIFNALESEGAHNLGDVHLKNLAEIKKTVDKLPEDQQKMFLHVMKKLFVSSGDSLKYMFKDSIIENLKTTIKPPRLKKGK